MSEAVRVNTVEHLFLIEIRNSRYARRNRRERGGEGEGGRKKIGDGSGDRDLRGEQERERIGGWCPDAR